MCCISAKKNKLFCPNVTLDNHNNVLEYIGRTKYSGFMLNSNGQVDEDMLKNCMLHKFAITNTIFLLNRLFQTCIIVYNVHVYQCSAKLG